MPTRTYNVLFLCTGNSARSIMAEAILNSIGRGRFIAYSAGSRPAGVPNPLAIELLSRNGIPTAGLRSKSWDEFARPDAPRIDLVVTVCARAAGEVCPVWPGRPMRAHWGVDDPAAVEGSDEAKRRAFLKAYMELRQRVSIFANLPVETLERRVLQERVDEIGQLGPAEDAA